MDQDPAVAAVLRDTRVSASAARLWALAAVGDPDAAGALGMSVRTARRLWKELAAVGWERPDLADEAAERPTLTADSTAPRVPSVRELLTTTTKTQAANFGRSEVESLFERVWSAWPRKKGKGAARTKFVNAVERNGAVVVEGLRRYLKDPNLPEPQFVPMLSTWLNQQRWLDGPEPERTNGRRPTAVGQTRATLIEYLEGDDGNQAGNRDGADDTRRRLPR